MYTCGHLTRVTYPDLVEEQHAGWPEVLGSNPGSVQMARYILLCRVELLLMELPESQRRWLMVIRMDLGGL
jgi:hypothetical protein